MQKSTTNQAVTPEDVNVHVHVRTGERLGREAGERGRGEGPGRGAGERGWGEGLGRGAGERDWK